MSLIKETLRLPQGQPVCSRVRFQKLSQSMPWLREKIRDNPITEEIRKLYKEAAVKAGGTADDVTDDVIRQSVEDATKATSPTENLAVQGEREFAIPLTQGQRTLDDAGIIC